jgi:hypothetical protein
MVNSNSESTRTHEDHDDEEKKSSMIVKIKPRARARVKKRQSHVRVRPFRERIKRVKVKGLPSFSSSESVKETGLNNDFTSIDENTLEENEVAEIISLLERARSRSHDTIDIEEHVTEPMQNSRVMVTKQKRRKKKYY